MAWLYVNMSNQGGSFAARLTALPKRLGWAGCGVRNAFHALRRMVMLSNISTSMTRMSNPNCSLSLCWGYAFLHESVGNARLAAAAVNKLRDKSSAKKTNRAKGFSYLDELVEHQPCMDKPVTAVTNDMTGCLHAGGNVKFKKVSTPFLDD